jgi:DNA-binding PadR family transcriptional regulator
MITRTRRHGTEGRASRPSTPSADRQQAAPRQLRPGTLYGALERLAGQGFITVEREEIVDGRMRRYYRLSHTGADTLAEQAERLRKRSAAAQAQLRRRPQLSGGAA